MIKSNTNNPSPSDSSLPSHNEDQHPSIAVDLRKRQTLKAGVAMTGAAMALSVSGAALAAVISPDAQNLSQDSLLNAMPLGQFTAQVRHSWASNDIEIVLTNKGSHASTITSLTPASLATARGVFDFDEILASGPLTLAPGESVSVALRHQKVDASVFVTQSHRGSSGIQNSLGHFDHSLQNRMRQTLSIVTENDALAAITIPNSPVLA